MTHEQAIDLLIMDIAVSKAGVKHCHDEVGREALRMAINALREQALRTAIEALEQKPCEDCISRQAMLDGLASIAKAKARSDAQKSLMGRVMFFTEHLPSVTPQPKRGRWIIDDKEGGRIWRCHCSECKKDPQIYVGGSENWWLVRLPNYCPNCGAKMVEPQGHI